MRMIRAHSLYFLLILTGLILCEVTFVALFMSYLPTSIKFMLWEDMGFLLPYFLEDPLATFKFVLVDKPILVIESRLENPSTAVWGLHYYSYSLLAHIISALVLAHLINPVTRNYAGQRYKAILGSGLLLVSSIYLYLSSCCTGGANWVIQTLWLAIITDPTFSTEALISTYQDIEVWFFWSQLVIAATGFYFMIKWYRGWKADTDTVSE